MRIEMAKIVGTDASDQLAGKTGGDQIYGDKGNDTIIGATAGNKELLVDGSFETAAVSAHTWTHFAQVGGWQSDTGVEVWGKDFIKTASNGDKLMELDYDNKFSKVWQDVKTSAGEELTLNLDTAARPGVAASTNGINIFWNDKQVAHIEPGKDWKTSEFKVIGTGGNDRLEFREDAKSNDSLGGLIDNVSLKSQAAGNLLVGGTGNDKIVAGNFGDTLVGGDAKVGANVDMTKMKITEAVNAHVHFDGSGAGYHNTVGMYTYDDKGNITATKLLFNDVSAQGVKGGPSAFDMALKAGQHIGFFVAPNAAGQSDIQKLVAEGGTFHLVNTKDGAPANVKSGEPMQIAYETKDHQWSVVHTQYWTDIYTTNTKSNADGFQHAKVTTDPVTGQLHVAFEDLQGGGDKNFFDANFTVDIGTNNTLLMAHEHTAGKHIAANDDVLIGGNGNDSVLGMSGNDKLYGGQGNDKLYGGSGDDVLDGGSGTNVVDGGSGNDRIIAGGGNDVITGGAGFDTIDFSGASYGVTVDLNKHFAVAGTTADKIYGVEAIVGSAFADQLSGNKGDNVIDGGAGNDLIRGGKGADVLIGGDGNDTFIWSKSDVGTGVDHIKDFSKGDRLDLHDLLKSAKGSFDSNVKLVDDVAGSHLMAKVGGSFVEVAMLDGVHNTSATDLLKAGMLLV